MGGDTLHKRAITARALATTGRTLAVEGFHRDAAMLTPKIREHCDKLAAEYLSIGVNSLPDTTNGRLVREIAFEAIFTDPQKSHEKLIGFLKEASKSDDHEVTLILRDVRHQIPDLDSMVDSLKSDKE